MKRAWQDPRLRFSKRRKIFAVVLLVLAVACPAIADVPRGERLSLPEFRARFAAAHRQGDRAGMRTLAEGHRDLLRAAVTAALRDYVLLVRPPLPAAPGSEAWEAIAVGEDLAKLSELLSNDPFPRARSTGTVPGRRICSSGRGKRISSRSGPGCVSPGTLRGRGQSRNGRARHLHGARGRGGGSGNPSRPRPRAAETDRLPGCRPMASAGARSCSGKRRSCRARTALIDLGDVEERRKDHPGAISYYRKAQEIFRHPEDWMEAGRALRQIGDIHVVRGSSRTPTTPTGERSGTRKRVGTRRRSPRGGLHGLLLPAAGGLRKGRGPSPARPGGRRRDSGGPERARNRARALNHLGLCTAKLASVAATEGNVAAAGKQYREALRLEEERCARPAPGTTGGGRDTSCVRWRRSTGNTGNSPQARTPRGSSPDPSRAPTRRSSLGRR